MGLGAYVFGIIGAFVRWSLKGFKGTYKEVWDGPKYKDSTDAAAYEITNNIIGIVTTVLLCLIILLLGC